MGVDTAVVGSHTEGTHNDHEPSGMIVTGNPVVLVGKIDIATVGSIVIANCDHEAVGVVAVGSGTVLSAGQGVARVGDSFVGSYEGTIQTGDVTVMTGG